MSQKLVSKLHDAQKTGVREICAASQEIHADGFAINAFRRTFIMLQW